MRCRIVIAALLSLVLVGLIAAPRAYAQDETFTLEVVVNGTEVQVTLTDIVVPIGAVDIEITGLGPLAEDCVLPSGFGLCSESDGVLGLAVINPTGWGETAELMTATTTSPPLAPVRVEIRQVVDVAGVDLVGTAQVSSHASASDGGRGWPVSAAVAVGVVIAVAVILTTVRRRRSRSAADLGD